MPDIDSGYEMIRKIAEREVDRLHLLEYGKIESVNVHSSEDDKVGYTCSVLLLGRTTDDGQPLKLENVPIMTQHTGDVIPPYINDMVLISYINGDFELPIIIGRLFHKEKLPPLFEEGEYKLIFDPANNRKDDGEELVDRRLISFVGVPEEGKQRNEYMIDFKDGTTINYTPSQIGLKTNYLEGDTKGDTEASMVIESGSEDDAIVSMTVGRKSSKFEDLLAKGSKKFLKLDIDSLLKIDNIASISLESKEGDESVIQIKRGDSLIKIDTTKPTGKDKATITVEAGKSKITLKQDGDIEIKSEANIKVTSKEKMDFEAKKDMSFKAENIKMNSTKATTIEAGSDGTFKTTAKAKIESGAAMDIKAGATGKFESTAPMTIKSGATAEISASAIMTVKGSLVKIN